MLLSKSVSFSFRVSDSPNVTQIDKPSSIDLGIDFFFRVGLPPYESKDVLKKKLKSPGKIYMFVRQIFNRF